MQPQRKVSWATGHQLLSGQAASAGHAVQMASRLTLEALLLKLHAANFAQSVIQICTDTVKAAMQDPFRPRLTACEAQLCHG